MSTPKKLIVYSIDLNDLKKTEMARFELMNGDVVHAVYKNKIFEKSLKKGLYSKNGKTVNIENGEEFMKLLERNYSSSSTVIVERL